jgi:hypothetical protein
MQNVAQDRVRERPVAYLRVAESDAYSSSFLHQVQGQWLGCSMLIRLPTAVCVLLDAAQDAS